MRKSIVFLIQYTKNLHDCQVLDQIAYLKSYTNTSVTLNFKNTYVLSHSLSSSSIHIKISSQQLIPMASTTNLIKEYPL